MTERTVLRRMIEEEHGISNYADDLPAAMETTDFMPAGHVVDIPFFDDDGVEEIAQLWCPPGASIGTVQPTRRTKAHARGYAYDDRTDRAVGFSSTYELNCLRVFLANRHVVEIQDQPPARPYLGGDGKRHHHRYDYRITFASGESWAVESTGIQDIRTRTRENLVGFAHRDILVTERTASIGKAWNSKEMIKARRHRDERACAAMRRMLSDVHGTISAFQLARQFLSFCEGLAAVWCLLHDGILAFVEPHKKLVDSPWVRVRHSLLGGE